MMRLSQLTAVRAFHHAWYVQFFMRTTLVFHLFGCSSFWYCHAYTPFNHARNGRFYSFSFLSSSKDSSFLKRGSGFCSFLSSEINSQPAPSKGARLKASASSEYTR